MCDVKVATFISKQGHQLATLAARAGDEYTRV